MSDLVFATFLWILTAPKIQRSCSHKPWLYFDDPPSIETPYPESYSKLSGRDILWADGKPCIQLFPCLPDTWAVATTAEQSLCEVGFSEVSWEGHLGWTRQSPVIQLDVCFWIRMTAKHSQSKITKQNFSLC